MPIKKIPTLIWAGLVLMIASVTFTGQATGQTANHLILLKRGHINKVNFFTGDPITFVREGNEYAEETYLQGIGRDYILVSGEEIPIKKISCLVRENTGFNFRVSGKALMIAAPGYLVIGAVNNLFQHVSPVPTVSNLIVAGVLLAAGAVLPAFQVRKYTIGRKFSLKIVQSDPAFNR